MARGVCPITKLSLQNMMWLVAFWKEPSWTPDFSACTSSCRAGPAAFSHLGMSAFGAAWFSQETAIPWNEGICRDQYPRKVGGMGLEGAGELVGTLSECAYGNTGDSAWGTEHFFAYNGALSVMPDIGQCWVTAVRADSQHDPVSLLSASKQALSSQPGTGDNAQKNLS